MNALTLVKAPPLAVTTEMYYAFFSLVKKVSEMLRSNSL